MPAARWSRLLLAGGLAGPPLLFFGWMLWSPLTIGNDYVLYQVRSAQSLRFFTGQGMEPMWYPYQTGGIPIGGLFFAQYFHWPAWLASQIPAYWTGEMLRLVTARHLLLFAGAHGLFYLAFRRAARLGRLVSYLLSFSCVYHLRNLDALRYGAGIEGTLYAQAVVLLVVLYGLGPSWALALALAAVCQLLLTCGYPVAIPFAGLALLAAVPVLVREVGWGNLPRRLGTCAGAALAGALLAAPHWLAFTEWLAVNDLRGARTTLAWAAAWPLTARGLLDNLLLPWRAEVHSAFGGATLVTLVLLGVLLRLVGTRRGALGALALAFPIVYAFGQQTPVFGLLFEHVPGFSMLRVPGRGLVMLPLLLVLACAWLHQARAGERPSQPILGWRLSALVLALLAAAASWIAAGGAQDALPEYSPALLTDYWSVERQLVWLGLGMIATIALGLAGRWRGAAALTLAATLAQTSMLMAHGTWLVERVPTASVADFLRLDHLPLHGQAPFQETNDVAESNEATSTAAYARFLRAADSDARCFLPAQATPRRTRMLLPFYLSTVEVCAAGPDEIAERLRDGCSAELPAGRVILGPPCEAGPSPAGAAAVRQLAEANERNRIDVLTPNRLSLSVDTEHAAVLVTPFPDATDNWTVWLDGRRAPLLQVNGSFVGLRVPPGRHRLAVRYFSRRLVLGYRIAFVAALALLAGGLVWRVRTRRPGLSRSAAALLVLALVALAWPGYRVWERRFVARACLERSFNHGYPALLERQLSLWRASAPAAGERGVSARGSGRP